MASATGEIDRRFLTRLEELLPLAGNSWAEVGVLIGVDDSTLHRWKKAIEYKGIYQANLDALCAICKKANCTPDRLFLPAETAARVVLRLEKEGWTPEQLPMRTCLFDRPQPGIAITTMCAIPLVSPTCIRFRFVGMGAVAPEFAAPEDELWLDVGNRLCAGVIDHHQRAGGAASSTRLVSIHPEYITRAVRAGRLPADPFTIVVQENIDLDSMASAYLAISYLTTGSFPGGKDLRERFVAYVDRIDQGYLCMSLSKPFPLYSAFMTLTRRIRAGHAAQVERAGPECVRQSFRLFDHVLSIMEHHQTSLLEINAFECPGLFDSRDRDSVQTDIRRYEEKLADPACHARQGRLRLPLELGGTREVDAVLVRDVAAPGDPAACRFFKTWARSDSRRAPRDDGFALLSQFNSGGGGRRYCIISIKAEVAFDPESAVTLYGLGERLEAAERSAREQQEGRDSRRFDPQGRLREPRPGYDHPDPWYDGRGHRYTIIDAPRAGTILTADQVEDILLDFGRADSHSFVRLA